ncbi:unnamed protein product [Heterosigma akashiwo]
MGGHNGNGQRGPVLDPLTPFKENGGVQGGLNLPSASGKAFEDAADEIFGLDSPPPATFKPLQPDHQLVVPEGVEQEEGAPPRLIASANRQGDGQNSFAFGGGTSREQGGGLNDSWDQAEDAIMKSMQNHQGGGRNW